MTMKRACRLRMGSVLRAQFAQEQHLVADLTATGGAVLLHRPTSDLPQTAHEHVSQLEPIMRLRVLAALTSSIAFRAAREIGRVDEANINDLITNQVLARRRWPAHHAPARLGAACHDAPPECPLPQPRPLIE